MASQAPRKMTPERIYDLLLNARTATHVTMHFKDGRVLHGSLVFNQFKGTGRLINAAQGLTVDFSVDDIRTLQL